MDYCGWSTLHVWASPGCPYGCLGKSASIPIPSDPCYPRCGFLWNSCVPNTLSLPSCSIIFSSYHWPFSGRAHFRTQPCVIPCTLLYPKRWNKALKSWWRACRACLKWRHQMDTGTLWKSKFNPGNGQIPILPIYQTVQTTYLWFSGSACSIVRLEYHHCDESSAGWYIRNNP